MARLDWPGLNGIVVIDRCREIRATSERETRLYSTALILPAQSLGAIVRSHWAVENSLHREMDRVFRDDEGRVRTDTAPANFTTRRHIALNLTRTAPGKDSAASNDKVAAWDDDFLKAIVTQGKLTRSPCRQALISNRPRGSGSGCCFTERQPLRRRGHDEDGRRIAGSERPRRSARAIA